MEFRAASWAQFKSLVSSKALYIQYVEYPDRYMLAAPEANSEWFYSLQKLNDDGSTNSDATDFENNFKTTSNQPLELKSALGRPIRVSASPQPVGTVEHWKGFQITVPIGQTSAYVDITFPSTVYIRGGYIVSPDVDFDDFVSVDVLVAANSAVYMSGLVANAYVIPNVPVTFESAESMMLPTSLKLRATLNLGVVETGIIHANILVDYFV